MTSAPPISEPVKLLADPHARLEWARNALERAAGDDTDALRDLAAVLVSLELVARRQSATPTASTATGEFATDASRGTTHVRGSAIDDNGQASGSLLPNTRRPDPSEPGALRGDLNDTANQRTWSQYMQEMYCNHPVAEGPPSSDRSTASPLPLSESLATDLQRILATKPPAEASDELLRRLIASLDTPPAAHTRLDSSSSSPSYPEPLSLETMRAITASLAAARESEPRRRRQRQAAHRQAVATVLDHYLSTRCSDVNSRDAALLDAVWPIESSGSDEGASTTQQEVTAPRTSAEATAPTSDDDDDDEDDEADTRSLATGIREAHESIARKDDKLTWLLGDGFRSGNVAPPPPTNPSATAPVPAAVPRNGKTKRTAVPPIVMPLPLPLPLPLSASGSSSSMMEYSSRHSGQTSFRSFSQGPHSHSHLHAHRRQGSNSSSSFVTPLLRHRRSASTTGTGRISSGGAKIVVPSDADADAEAEARPRLERQRSLSVGEGTHLLTLATAAGTAGGGGGGGDSSARSGPPMLGSVVDPPRSPRSDKPFADLAPVTAAEGGSFDTPTSSTTSTRLLLDRNTLTNSERRELVRRSKKLEGFFGAPFQEATAQRILVDGRLAPPLPPRSSEPDDSEAGDRLPSPEEPPTANKPEKLVIDTAASAAATATTSKAPSSAASSTVSPLSSPRRPTFAPPRRESLAAPRMHRSSSSPSRRSASFSSLASADHTYYSEQSRWRFPMAVEDEQRQSEREERRKKLEKVRRFLGERVPVEVVIPCHEPPGAATERAPREAALRSGHVKSASDHWRRGKRLISGKRPAPTTAGADFLAPPTGPGGGPIPVQNAEEWPYIEPNWQPDEAQLRAAEANHHNDAVDALSKARKLENLFGQLPPSSLYLGPEFGRPRPPPTLQHRHSSSDLASAYSPFAQGATVGGWVPAPDSLGRSASSASSGRGGAADTYRRSIASLSYVAERDPDAMDEVVRVYAAGPRDEPVPEADETADEDDDDDEGPTPEAALMTRSVSAQSVRALRQAQKLSQVLGTTKGAVWGMLLRDLQEAIMDDETLDEEERGDVLRSLDKLRRTAVAA